MKRSDILKAAWLSVLLGVGMELALLAAAAGFAKAREAAIGLAGLVIFASQTVGRKA